MQQYDIAIVGGGLVGATLAAALERLSYRVVVLEAFSLDSAAQPSFDDRSVALSYGSRLLLQTMGLWQAVSPYAQGIQEIQISERQRLGLTRMSAQEEGVDALGYVVENRDLGKALFSQFNGAEWLAPAQVSGVNVQADGVVLDYEYEQQPQQLQARLLVAADGAHSKTRAALGISASQTDYGLSAIIANVQTQLPHKGVAYERFTATGPLALLPLQAFEGHSRSALVLTVKHEEVEALMAMETAEFAKQLQQRFGQRLGRIQKIGQRAAYPVALLEADRTTAPRSVVIGNAAQSLNPVAGQGFNLALRDVADLLEQLSATCVEDPGDAAVLQAYSDSRQRDRQSTIRFTDTLVNVFSNTLTPLAHARAGGLLAADLLEPLRQQFVRQGMGLTAKQRVKGL